MKNVLIIGGGGREHAIIMKLLKSKNIGNLYCTPGNGGIAKYIKCFNVSATDINGVVNLTKKLKPDMVIVSPDDPLVHGMVDALHIEGVMTFGPRKNAAIIEGSKVFAKNFMKKYNIPTAFYEVFTESDKAISYIREQSSYPIVIKADGLAFGKGVTIASNEEDAVHAVHNMIDELKFGKSSSRIVIEEFLTGSEVSILSFTDGKTIIPMISSMDHKRILDGDIGLNTGGMGTISPNPYYTTDIANECMEKIFIPTVNGMNAEGRNFEGCLYFGLMITSKGPKVIEYNCRFGDPETQVILHMMDTDLYDIFEAIYNHELDKIDIKWKNGSCACIVMASAGYPESYSNGFVINGLNDHGQIDGCFIYHAGTKLSDNGKFLTNGGRVIGVTAIGDNLNEALNKAYKCVKQISFDGAYYRNDIGSKALAVMNGSN